jgi:hypothetical protein
MTFIFQNGEKNNGTNALIRGNFPETGSEWSPYLMARLQECCRDQKYKFLIILWGKKILKKWDMF